MVYIHDPEMLVSPSGAGDAAWPKEAARVAVPLVATVRRH